MEFWHLFEWLVLYLEGGLATPVMLKGYIWRCTQESLLTFFGTLREVRDWNHVDSMLKASVILLYYHSKHCLCILKVKYIYLGKLDCMEFCFQWWRQLILSHTVFKCSLLSISSLAQESGLVDNSYLHSCEVTLYYFDLHFLLL